MIKIKIAVALAAQQIRCRGTCGQLDIVHHHARGLEGEFQHGCQQRADKARLRVGNIKGELNGGV